MTFHNNLVLQTSDLLKVGGTWWCDVGVGGLFGNCKNNKYPKSKYPKLNSKTYYQQLKTIISQGNLTACF